MQRFPAKKSNLFDSGTDPNHHHHQPPLCPKPRRLKPSVPDFLKPPKCNKHNSQQQPTGILHLISDERVDVKDPTCTASCFAGSPPRRTNNPLIHDIKFVHQMELLSPFSRTNFSAPAQT
ncbi:hypothetical protein LWI28_016867 [Acer negundo]|uniref:Uncharacterized protein n=1 Tax=Acer negundo TaxID=4023 RepID=A0AAD5IIJ6_ACENE|nr:hypothetical protein LWI28_016867 [Acer negundo]KAK4844667.1 hypothetical protein QYF36_022885 [Acer negundo]